MNDFTKILYYTTGVKKIFCPPDCWESKKSASMTARWLDNRAGAAAYGRNFTVTRRPLVIGTRFR